jgi:hypothetical protein
MATTASPEPAAGPDTAKIAAVAAAAIGAALTLGALALFNGRTALSVGAGTVIAVANLVTMNAIIRAMLRPAEAEAEAEAAAEAAAKAAGEPNDEAPEPARDHVAEGKRGGAAWGAFALVKILVLFGGIYVLLTRGLVDPIPLVIGYGVLPLGITVSGLFNSLAPRPRRGARRTPTRTE